MKPPRMWSVLALATVVVAVAVWVPATAAKPKPKSRGFDAEKDDLVEYLKSL